MRVSNYFMPTRKEIPKEAEIPSHQMMLRAGLIRQHLAGVYSILPLGWRVLTNIMKIIREEMDRIGCHEFYLPVLSSADLWTKSGRWNTFGEDMFRLKDRKGREMCLAPTHEEVFAEIVSHDIRSYRDLPQMWYQIQTKFRDEVRPRSGLLRVRQFFMKDAYSFDTEKAGLDESYRLQREAYLRIFERTGLDVKVVKASSGAMGGRDCEEFMVLSDSGDDEIVNCPSCGYAANQEVAESNVMKVYGSKKDLKKVLTPDKRTIEDVSAFLEIEPSRLVKSLVYIREDDKKPVFILVRGDHQVDEGKLEAVLGECRPAEPEEVKKLTGADVGFVSPVGLNEVEVFADPILEGTTDLVAGANEDEYHVIGVDMQRDIEVKRFVQLRVVQATEPCSVCGTSLEVSRTIEVGHIFKLGTRYTEALGAEFLDENGVSHPIIMGSYGIGVERIMACAIEKNFDGSAMIWPREITPFLIEILPLNVTVGQVADLAEDLYADLSRNNVSVILDDRDDRAGVKFKDADLLGAPVLVVIGERNLKDGLVELRIKDKRISENVKIEDLKKKVYEALDN
ncbi:MAG: proline--tRNA ligase [Candidatus Latescibacteria bacterium]|nr:proline--tRNA ligase [Candidatus Latescibacterota bacterium]